MVKVAFIHPDLGIGGAERLVCDSALALKSSGHTVKIFTSHHDPSHCFAETRDGSLDVEAVGDFLPRQVLWKFYAFFAYLRMLYVAHYLVIFSSFSPDVIICDQISACIPVLRMWSRARIIFYCHFPDMLLTQRKSLLKRLYRAPIDWLEEVATGMADEVLVNSQFTSNIFTSTFTSLSHIKPRILYPSLNTKGFTKPTSQRTNPLENKIPPATEFVFLSINRYERKKNLNLAIEALSELKKLCDDATWKKVQLVVAGGYDERVTENKEHYLELGRLASDHKLLDNIVFLCSFSDEDKIYLLKNSTCLLYTPSNEHFGIVPIEAMFMKLPVIACNSGGPLETVDHEVTGYLCESDPKAFGKAMHKFVQDKSLKSRMGESGRERVDQHFSFASFTKNLDSTVNDVLKSPSHPCCGVFGYVKVFFLLVVVVILTILYFLS